MEKEKGRERGVEELIRETLERLELESPLFLNMVCDATPCASLFTNSIQGLLYGASILFYPTASSSQSKHGHGADLGHSVSHG